MKKLYKIIILGILTFLNIHSFAQKSTDRIIQPGAVMITLKLLNYEKVPDTMYILLRVDPFKIGGGDEYIAIKDDLNQFKFHLPALAAPARILIKNQLRPATNQEYWVEPNDNVKLEIKAQAKNTQVIATGNGNGKYRYSAYLDSAYKANIKIGEKHPYTAEFLNNEIRFLDTRYSFGEAILNKFRPYISPNMSKIFQAESVGKNIRSKWAYVSIYRAAAPNDTGIINRVLVLENEKAIATVDLQAALSSPNYIYGNKLAAMMYNGAKYSGIKSVIAQTYDYLKTKYSGLLGEYLITSYLIDRPAGDTNDFKNTLINAVSFVKNRELNARLKQLLSALTYDTATQPHLFIDTKDKNRALSEWKGKVILIDFWFNGCVHCKGYAEVFEKKILPVFRGNPNVVFVGMNTDRDKKRWLEGIKSKEYTSEATINLFTLGQGFSHPFPKMFNVVGAPTLFLIDKNGRLIETNLTRDPDQIIKQLKSALSK